MLLFMQYIVEGLVQKGASHGTTRSKHRYKSNRSQDLEPSTVAVLLISGCLMKNVGMRKFGDVFSFLRRCDRDDPSAALWHSRIFFCCGQNCGQNTVKRKIQND